MVPSIVYVLFRQNSTRHSLLSLMAPQLGSPTESSLSVMLSYCQDIGGCMLQFLIRIIFVPFLSVVGRSITLQDGQTAVSLDESCPG